MVKTTIDIADNLLNRARQLARREKSTLKELTEEGLQLVLSRRERPEPRKIKPVVVRGKGLSPAFRGKPWAQFRDEIYRDSGA